MSATCDWCDLPMDPMRTCSGNTKVEFPDGSTLASIASEEEPCCHDCNVMVSGYHHPGCDAEKCPKCQGQLISCGCLDEEEV